MRIKYVARLCKRSPDGDRDHLVLMLSAKGADPDRCDDQIRQIIGFRYPDYQPVTIKRLKIHESNGD